MRQLIMSILLLLPIVMVITTAVYFPTIWGVFGWTVMTGWCLLNIFCAYVLLTNNNNQ